MASSFLNLRIPPHSSMLASKLWRRKWMRLYTGVIEITFGKAVLYLHHIASHLVLLSLEKYATAARVGRFPVYRPRGNGNGKRMRRAANHHRGEFGQGPTDSRRSRRGHSLPRQALPDDRRLSEIVGYVRERLAAA